MIVLLTFIGCAPDFIREEGRQAARLGITPAANPYVRDMNWSREWYGGYIEEKQKLDEKVQK